MTVARPNFRAGDLRHVIVLQKPDPASLPDSVGDSSPAWLDVATVYASIDPLSGREAIIAAQRQASTTHTLEMYYDSAIAAIDASWRVKFGTRYFTIDAPPANPAEANVFLRLSCTESVRKE